MDLPSYDYIVVGGGTAGLTLASRLRKLLGSSSILVIEAGGNPSEANAHEDYENVRNYTGIAKLRSSPITNWMLTSEDGPGLNGRTGDAGAGKGLGGSSLINAGMWMRGPRTDWDYWAQLVDDEDWSYDKMVKYFRLSENVALDSTDGKKNELQHGYDGYLKVRATETTNKKFPLRNKLAEMWQEAGVEMLSDMNSGEQNGACDAIDVWDEGGRRRLPSEFLDLRGVDTWTNTFVARVLLTEQDDGSVATGVQLADGRQVRANKEVVLSAGAYHSPKLLQLSGIGPSDLLSQHNIEVKLDNPHVGANLADHLMMTTTWELRSPEDGLAFGSPACNQPFWLEGYPQDFIQYEHIPTDPDSPLVSVLTKDEAPSDFQDSILRPDASHIQNWIVYMPLPAAVTGVDVPMDGRFISTFTCLATPTSRGRVTIRSADSADPPRIEKNFQSTATDRYMLTHGLRRLHHIITNTSAGHSFISHEIPPSGFGPVTPDTTPDAEIESRIAQFAWSINHPMGTCGMGRVVDSHCRVLNVQNLRVVDASVIPFPPAATIQAAVYAVAERVAGFIAGGG